MSGINVFSLRLRIQIASIFTPISTIESEFFFLLHRSFNLINQIVEISIQIKFFRSVLYISEKCPIVNLTMKSMHSIFTLISKEKLVQHCCYNFNSLSWNSKKLIYVKFRIPMFNRINLGCHWLRVQLHWIKLTPILIFLKMLCQIASLAARGKRYVKYNPKYSTIILCKKYMTKVEECGSKSGMFEIWGKVCY